VFRPSALSRLGGYVGHSCSRSKKSQPERGNKNDPRPAAEWIPSFDTTLNRHSLSCRTCRAFAGIVTSASIIISLGNLLRETPGCLKLGIAAPSMPDVGVDPNCQQQANTNWQSFLFDKAEKMITILARSSSRSNYHTKSSPISFHRAATPTPATNNLNRTGSRRIYNVLIGSTRGLITSKPFKANLPSPSLWYCSVLSQQCSQTGR
jgi:hypothetical protein